MHSKQHGGKQLPGKASAEWLTLKGDALRVRLAACIQAKVRCGELGFKRRHWHAPERDALPCLAAESGLAACKAHPMDNATQSESCRCAAWP